MPESSPVRRSSNYTVEEKQALVGPGLTVNGHPAVVSGYQHEFATVTRKDDGMSAEFAWGTIERARSTGADLTT
ncbi:hypothetical protein [Rhodococcus qingshengii]|uniref:hypothetical protein n=1 Tax=Rhodococcus qingshengii TaxID=334542 RepID=UPI00287FCA6F|nr:hypothetical protein [Rhodococcus qingshengii]